MPAFTDPNSGKRKFHKGGRSKVAQKQLSFIGKLRQEYNKAPERFTMTFVEYLKHSGVDV